MRVAINCRSILKAQLTGIGRYTYHVLDCLGQVDTFNDYMLYCPKRLFDFKRRLPSFPYKNFHTKVDFFGLGVRQSVKQFDCYHLPSPDHLDVEGRVIVTVHDLVYKTYPQSHTAQTIELTEKYMQHIVAKAAKIVCISESTRRDLHQFFDLPQSRSCVVYNGVDHNIFYALNENQKKEAFLLLEEKGISDPYILFVGTMEPRKNLTNLLKAFGQLKTQGQFKGKLVVIGMKGWMAEQINPLIVQLGIGPDVIFMGYVTDAELRVFYNCATVFVFPSFYEGFGFPILEAFCCGAAVVTSNVSSCPEIAGDAALLIDPNSVEQIAEAISSIFQDKPKADGLKQKALERAKQFSFLRTAQETLKVYQEVVS